MKTVLVVLIVLAAVAVGVAYSGVYNVAADDPHWRISERALQLVRERSIEKRASEIQPPADLADPKRVLAGAGEYAEMCESCHLAPGVADSELRQGLNPKPPQLARVRADPREAFWIVKHGIKMTGMPAWGNTHDDEVLWSVVAFLQKLPQLDAKGYRDLVAKAAPHEEKGAPGHAHAPGTPPHRD
jgi:mono/diheme cytochrome c family protein